MIKAVRASINAGILSWITSRPKVVPLSSQYPLQQGFLLTESGNFLVQENGFYIIL
jgi:hypothetical protein